MFGRHYDTRVEKHFVPIYSKVPYLDTQIFNIQMQGLRESRRTRERTVKAIEGLQRARLKSEILLEGLKNSRLRQEQENKRFIEDIQVSQKVCLEKEVQTWKSFSDEKRQSRIDNIRDQKYLDDLLLTNSTKAASRLTSVRRWY